MRARGRPRSSRQTSSEGQASRLVGDPRSGRGERGSGASVPCSRNKAAAIEASPLHPLHRCRSRATCCPGASGPRPRQARRRSPSGPGPSAPSRRRASAPLAQPSRGPATTTSRAARPQASRFPREGGCQRSATGGARACAGAGRSVSREKEDSREGESTAGPRMSAWRYEGQSAGRTTHLDEGRLRAKVQERQKRAPEERVDPA